MALPRLFLVQTLMQTTKGFEKALAEAGFKEGVQITYIRKNSHGKVADAQAIAQKFVDEKVDLIHCIATPYLPSRGEENKEYSHRLLLCLRPCGCKIGSQSQPS